MADGGYGPSGYLPERAAKRARKIVLRAPLGLTWIIASVAAAVVVLLLGVVYLVTVAGPPGEPFVAAAEIDDIDPRGAQALTAGGREALVVRGGGAVRAFAHPGGTVGWCEASRRIEAGDGRVWEPSGRLVGGEGSSLAPLPAEVHDGTLYLDPTAPGTAPEPRPQGVRPACDP